jgi:hypothetical protein
VTSAATHRFALRFPESEIDHWAGKYRKDGEQELLKGAVARTRERGYLDMPDFLAVTDWKSTRPRKFREANDAPYVEEITKLALATSTSPRLAVESLTLLSGVSLPTASAILHLCHTEAYPILDFRALWSLQCPVAPPYDYVLWEQYTAFMRRLCGRVERPVRTVDRALWQYSKKRQPV